MFFRYIYIYLNKIINHKYFIYFTNMCSFDSIFLKDFSVKTLSSFDMFKLSFFPVHSNVDYNILNSNTLELLDFRKKFLNFFNLKFNDYQVFSYQTIISESFFKNLFDFIEECNGNYNNVKTIFKTKNNKLSLYYLLFFFKKNFSGFFSILFFCKFDVINLIKFYFILYYVFFKENIFERSKLFFLNVRKHSNWLLFFSKYRFNFIDFYFYKPISEKEEDKLSDLLPNSRTLSTIINNKKGYLEFYRSVILKFFDRRTVILIRFVNFIRLNLNRFTPIRLVEEFSILVKSYFPTKFNESSTNKFINLSKLDNFLFFFLRRHKIFNKGRYSRNRQTYRTGFYWCLWLNIFVVYGLHFVFYRFVFTFGYLWLLLFILFASFVFSRALKYNFVSARYVASEFRALKNIFYSLCESSFKWLYACMLLFFKQICREINPEYVKLYITPALNFLSRFTFESDLRFMDINDFDFSEVEVWGSDKFEEFRYMLIPAVYYLTLDDIIWQDESYNDDGFNFDEIN